MDKINWKKIRSIWGFEEGFKWSLGQHVRVQLAEFQNVGALTAKAPDSTKTVQYVLLVLQRVEDAEETRQVRMIWNLNSAFVLPVFHNSLKAINNKPSPPVSQWKANQRVLFNYKDHLTLKCTAIKDKEPLLHPRAHRKEEQWGETSSGKQCRCVYYEFSGMSLRDCDMFPVTIMFCSAVQVITGTCTTLRSSFPIIPTLWNCPFVSWVTHVGGKNDLLHIWDNRESATWQWQYAILQHIPAASRPWCHYMLITVHSKWLPLDCDCMVNSLCSIVLVYLQNIGGS